MDCCNKECHEELPQQCFHFACTSWQSYRKSSGNTTPSLNIFKILPLFAGWMHALLNICHTHNTNRHMSVAQGIKALQTQADLFFPHKGMKYMEQTLLKEVNKQVLFFPKYISGKEGEQPGDSSKGPSREKCGQCSCHSLLPKNHFPFCWRSEGNGAILLPLLICSPLPHCFSRWGRNTLGWSHICYSSQDHPAQSHGQQK